MRIIKLTLSFLIIALWGNNIYSQERTFADCETTISPEYPEGNVYLSNGAGSFIITVNTKTGCYWNVTGSNSTSSTWLTVTPEDGTGPGTFTVEYDANTLASYQISELEIEGNLLHLRQEPVTSTGGGEEPPVECPPYEPVKSLAISTLLEDDDCDIYNGLIQARDYIKLDGAFSYNAATEAPITIKANSDIVLDMEYESTEVDPGMRDLTLNDVGSLPGSINVSSSGAATYQLPISVPNGLGGLQPQISIAYNSQSGNGLLGFGWNIAGLSAITRTSQNYFLDNNKDGVDLQMTDRFALDGNRLIVTNLNYGEDNAQYHTEIESFSQIISHGTSGNGPSWFSVISKGGTSYEYGNTSNSKVEAQGKTTVLMWRLNKVIDINGNYMNFIYKEENGESWIESIEYSGNSTQGVIPVTKVHFYYDRKSDKNTLYVGGSELPQTVILRSIKIESDGTFLNEYQFKYLNDFYSLLTEISKIEHDGSQFNSTVINWGDETYQFFNTSFYMNDQEKDFYPADYNGDGKTDFLVTTRAPGEDLWEKWYLYISPMTLVAEGNLSSDFKGFYIADVNNDGAMDVYWRNRELFTYDCNCQPCGKMTVVSDKQIPDGKFIENSTLEIVVQPPDDDDECCDVCSYWQESFKYYYFNGSGLVRGSTNYDHNYNNTVEEIYMHPGDFNGDGQTDYLILEYLDKDYYFLDGLPINNPPDFNEPDKLEFIDFNGDGKLDIMLIKEANCKIYSYNNNLYEFEIIYESGFPTKWHEIFPGDFNGDGKSDLLVYAADPYNTWKVHFSNGVNFANSSVPPLKNVNPADNDSNDNFFVKDFNGDGKDDILEIYSVYADGSFSTSTFNFYFSKGDGDFYKEINAYNKPCDLNTNYHFGDFNGDGRQNVCYQGATGSADLFYTHKDEKKNLVHSITDAYNRSVRIAYEPLTKGEPFYTKSSGEVFPIIDAKVPLYAVCTVSHNGISGEIITTFEYEGAKIHRQGKGFLGFSKITKTNSLNNSIQENYSEIDDENYFLMASRNVSKIGSEIISDVVYTGDKKTYFSDKCFFPYTGAVVSNNFLNGTSSTTNNTFDNDGNLTLTNSTDSDGNSESVATTYITGSDPNTLFLPELIIRTNTIEADTKVTKSYIEYNTDFRIDKKTDFYETAKPILTLYEYDGFGNPAKVTTEADGEERYNSFTYDSKGLKLIEKNNNAEFKTKYEYDRFNNLIKSFDPNDALTEYKYNSFGRLIQSKTPAGYVTDYTLAWDDSNGPSNAVYYTLTESQGVANTKEYYDILGKVIRKETTGFGNQVIIKDYVYNQQGQLIEETDPHFDGDAYATKVYSYDTKGRIETITGDYIDVLHEYSGNSTKVTDKLLQTSYDKTYNAKGLLKTATDDDGTITYNYNGYGKTDEIITQDGTITMSYNDEHGNQTSLVDLNAGTMTYTYTGFGELLTQQDAKGNLFTMIYDDMGRIKTKTGPEGTVEYFYDGHKKALLDKVSHTNGITKEYEYDDLGRLEKSTETIDGQLFTYDYTYDTYGNMSSLTYPNGFAVTKQYDANGYLTQIHNQSTGSLIWELKSTDALGHIELTEYGNAIQEDKQYLNQRIESIDASQQFAETYNYNTFGNIEWRQHPSGLKETFTYDNLNRLETSQITGESLLTYEYYSNGNLKNKPGVGTFNYGQNGGGPHALSSVTNNSIVSTDLQLIDYNSINKVERIRENNYDMQFTYGTGGERKKVRTTLNGTNGQTKYFVGLYEKIDHDSGDVQEFNYITSPDGLIAMQTEDNTTGMNFYYVHKDFLGSVRALTNQAGVSIEEYAYDAWGKRVNPITRQLDTRTSFIINRGYTGHEHLDMFNLINMNGRVYDPVVSRFISADNNIQAPSFSQSYNRYSYCMNNPLMFSDPTGEEWWHWALGDILTGGAVSASISATSATAYSTLHVTAVTFQQVMSSLDYVSAPFRGEQDNPLGNSFEIDLGMALIPLEPLMDIFGVLPKDESATSSERFLTYVNYFLNGESIQDHFGNGFAHYQNMAGNIDEIGYYQGRTIIRVNDDSFDGYSGVSHGHYVFGENMALNPSDTDYDIGLFAHEFGHTYQSRISGPQYYLNWGVPSGLLDRDYPEDDADFRAFENFGIWPHAPRTTNPRRTSVWDYILGPFALFWYY
ncbi:MAG: hypothetical protein GQ564_18200 [Bacteroidales bacterium]|nr:hypothetical protein [Bacteroidales bacterium]